MFTSLFFILFAGLAVGCAVSMVYQRNPLYSAISLIGVFLSLACLYVTLAAPFIAAVQVIVYAGAIMVLVVFVIMLLNIEEEEHRITKLKYLLPAAIFLGVVLLVQISFVISTVKTNKNIKLSESPVGVTESIGTGLFTKYLLPFEITSLLLLMAIVGAMSLARRTATLSPTARVIPGTQVLPKYMVDPKAKGDMTAVEADTTEEVEKVLGIKGKPEE
jgi:NADH-quinone oxidoreductase subunit J